MAGRLVPTEAALARASGREYEHASVLLARILKERETSPHPLRSRRGLRTPLSAGGEGPGVRSQQPNSPCVLTACARSCDACRIPPCQAEYNSRNQ